jgi:hypothetical protein
MPIITKGSIYPQELSQLKPNYLKDIPNCAYRIFMASEKITFVRKTATIKNIQERFVGGAFSRLESNSRDIGFYLLGD